MKLFIQIPCFNEAETLPATLADLPRKLPGISKIETVIIDDGSTDATVEVARALGVNHILRNKRNMGLAYSFQRGLDFALANDADILVNTDGDNQYQGHNIEKLITPIIRHNADLVVGCRPISSIEHFSAVKKFLQRLGSRVVSKIANVDAKDATSGFRAYSREAMRRIYISDTFTYTLESLIQAGNSRYLIIDQVDISVNPKLRESRLMKSMTQYIFKSLLTMLRLIVFYKPVKVFLWPSILCFGLAAILGARYLINVFVLEVHGRTYVPSLILLTVLVGLGTVLVLFMMIAWLTVFNRNLIMRNIYFTRMNKQDGKSEETRRCVAI